MSGFPNRPTRGTFGPKLEDTTAPTNPEQDVPAAAFNLDYHQVVGLALANPAQVAVIANWNGSAFDYAHRSEAWNTDGSQTHPALARAGAGSYSLTLASTYKDQDGADIAIAPKAARVTVHKVLAAFANRVVGYAWIDGSNPLVLQVRLWEEATGTAVDAPFWLEVAV